MSKIVYLAAMNTATVGANKGAPAALAIDGRVVLAAKRVSALTGKALSSSSAELVCEGEP